MTRAEQAAARRKAKAAHENEESKDGAGRAPRCHERGGGRRIGQRVGNDTVEGGPLLSLPGV